MLVKAWKLYAYASAVFVGIGLIVRGAELFSDYAAQRSTARAYSHPWEFGVVQVELDDSYCTGVLVGDRTVVTAAHCLVDMKPSRLTVNFLGPKASPQSPPKKEDSVEALTSDSHPDYDEDIDYINDIGIIKLTRDAPEKWKRIPIKTGVNVGLGSYLMLGYGGGGDPFSARRDDDDIRLKTLALNSARAPYGDIITSLRLSPPYPCFGDSGGPVLEIGTGGPELVGVVSSILNFSPAMCSNIMYASPIRDWERGWIMSGRTRFSTAH